MLLFGVRQLLFNEGNELLAFPVVVAQMEIVVRWRQRSTSFSTTIKKDEHKLIFAGVIGCAEPSG